MGSKTTLTLDDDLIEWFRNNGINMSDKANKLLRQYKEKYEQNMLEEGVLKV